MNLNKTKDRLHFFSFAVILGIVILLSSGCGTSQVTPVPMASDTPIIPTLVPTTTKAPPSPTPTSQPLAARINGEDLPLSTLQSEIIRLQVGRAAAGLSPLPDEQSTQLALNELISQTLLAQAAYTEGYTTDEDTLSAVLQKMRTAQGDTWTDWLQTNAYTEDSLLIDLRRQMAAAWQRDRILATVPETMLQVHARQILVYNLEEAQNVYAQLQNGTDFATLASQYAPLTLGDLGWFPQGYLPFPQVEAAAFALQPGEYSNIIESDIGYHIVQTIERNDNRPLSSDARLTLQTQALKAWLTTLRQNSDIVLFLP